MSGSKFYSRSIFPKHTESPNLFDLPDFYHYFRKRWPVHAAIFWRGGKRHLRRETPLLMSLQKFRRDHPPSTSKIQGGRHPSPPGGEGYTSLHGLHLALLKASCVMFPIDDRPLDASLLRHRHNQLGGRCDKRSFVDAHSMSKSSPVIYWVSRVSCHSRPESWANHWPILRTEIAGNR